ncbi:uncharacterized protein [Solanum lycopersicum]|uniref:uncharacterized protein n=1 Tax=Solanum lycopersicum TaxID=4081 RepID=UPI00374A51A0
MGATDIEKAELASYQLKDIAQTWCKIQHFWEDSSPEMKEAKVEEFINLKQGSMTVREYSLKFVKLSRYATTLVSNSRDEMSRFLTRINGDLEKECQFAMLHDNMDLLGLMSAVAVEPPKRNRFYALKGKEEHEKSADVVKVLTQHQLYAKFIECEFWLRSVNFLGHVVSDQGVEVDPRKTEAVKNWPKPLTPTDIRSLLGLDGYNQRFVEGFSSIDAQLTALRNKKSKFEWTETCEKSFQELKDRLTSAPVLTLPKSGENYTVYCDASMVGLGYLLMQAGKVIAYAFRQLKVHEKNYPPHDLELAAVRKLNLRQRRWLELLKDYDINVHYHQGKANVVADSLSRMSMGSTTHVEDEKKDLVEVKAEHLKPCGMTQIIEVPTWNWEAINMDFVSTYRAEDYMSLYIDEIVRWNGIPLSIISERGAQFTSHFWRSFQKAWARRKRPLEFNVGDQVYFKISPMKGVMRFGRKGKLSLRYVGPYEILQCVGEVAYVLALPAELASVHPVFHVYMLKKCIGVPTSILPVEGLGVGEDLSYEEVLVEILERQVKWLRNKEIATVKVLWRNHPVEGVTWEDEADMRSRYPHLFSS